jgi:4-hydroxy-2-oxoheptanedioate aldolase
MRTSIVRKKWLSGKPALCCAIALCDPAVAELASMLGIDCLWIDMEHSARSLEIASNLMRAARVGSADVIARPAKGEFMRLGRLLEAGAQGIMYPRCSSADEAAEVVRWSRFHPVGSRGVDGGNADMPYCSMSLPEYIRMANEETFLLVQVEDPASLDQVEKIAKTPGLDGIFFGPGDFSVQAGIAEQFNHPIMKDAIRRVAAAAKSAGKVWGMPAFDLDHAAVILELGALFIAWGTDIVMLKEGFELIQKQFAPLGFTFGNKPRANSSNAVPL